MAQNYRRGKLRGKSFKGQDLTGADFSDSDIRGTDFTGAILHSANFSNAKAGLQRRYRDRFGNICITAIGNIRTAISRWRFPTRISSG